MKKEPNLSRRILIYATMAFCMTLIVWLAWNGTHNSELHQQIADGCFFTMGLIVLIYVLGANVDNLLAVLPFLRGGGPARRESDQRPEDRVPNYSQRRRREDPDDGID